MYNYDDMFSEDAEIVAGILDIAKGLVREEIKQRMTKLENDNADLRKQLTYYQNFMKEKADFEQRIRQLESECAQQYNKGYDECKKQRIQKLIDISVGYVVTHDRDFIGPKCNKCDDQRRIHFTSPSGKDLLEPCECSKTKMVFKVAKTPVQTFCFGYNGNMTDTPSRYYLRPEVREYGKYQQQAYLGDDHIWIYNDFTNLKLQDSDPKTLRQYHNYVFETTEDCQKYVDWLNENYEKTTT